MTSNRVAKRQQERRSSTVAQPRYDAVEAAWSRYLAARDRADRSRAIEDGIAAGHARHDFLDVYEGADRHDGGDA